MSHVILALPSRLPLENVGYLNETVSSLILPTNLLHALLPSDLFQLAAARRQNGRDGQEDLLFSIPGSAR